MTNDSVASDLVEILPRRFELLKAVRERPMTQKELSERVDISPSTTHRAVTTFVDLHVLERDDDQFTVTEFGDAVIDEYGDYVEHLETLCDRQHVYSSVSDSISFQSPIFANAEIFFNQPYALDAASHKNRHIIQNSTTVRSVLDGIASSYLVTHELLLDDDDHETTLVVSDDVAAALLNTYQAETRKLLQSDQFDLFRAAHPVPYTITIAETDSDTYAILMKHEKNTVTFNVRNNKHDAISWAEDQFAQYLDDSERITTADLG